MIDSQGIRIEAGMNVLFDGYIWEVGIICKDNFHLFRPVSETLKREAFIDVYITNGKLPKLESVDIQK